jgi:hypothetical protein
MARVCGLTKLVCPISRVFCEKWGLSAGCTISRVEHRIPIPITSDENLSRLS